MTSQTSFSKFQERGLTVTFFGSSGISVLCEYVTVFLFADPKYISYESSIAQAIIIPEFFLAILNNIKFTTLRIYDLLVKDNDDLGITSNSVQTSIHEQHD
jgi:hypothetical protein